MSLDNIKNEYGYKPEYLFRIQLRLALSEWGVRHLDEHVAEWCEYHEQIMYPYDRDYVRQDAYDWNNDRAVNSLVGFFLPDGF